MLNTANVTVNHPSLILPFDKGFTFREEPIKPWEVTNDKLKSHHGEIISYFPPTIFVGRNYGGIDVQDEGLYVKPELDLYHLFTSTFKRTPFANEHIEFVIARDVAIIASCVKVPAIQLGSNWNSNVRLTLTNYGRIYGRGGDAGVSAWRTETWVFNTRSGGRTWYSDQNYRNDSATESSPGLSGGHAFGSNGTNDVQLHVLNYGRIAGGGGGGGGSGFFTYSAYSGGQDSFNETSGCLSNSGGAPYGRPFSWTFGWQYTLMDTATGSLKTAWDEYKNSDPIAGKRNAALEKMSATEYRFHYDPGTGFKRIDVPISEIPEDSLLFKLNQPNTRGFSVSGIGFNRYGSYMDPVTGEHYANSITTPVGIVALRSGIKAAAEPGGDLGSPTWMTSSGAVISPYDVLMQRAWGNAAPSSAERETLLRLRVGSRGGNPGEVGGMGTDPTRALFLNVYQQYPDTVLEPMWGGIKNGVPKGTLNLLLPASSGGDAGQMVVPGQDLYIKIYANAGTSSGGGING